jgi:hypothetical protein
MLGDHYRRGPRQLDRQPNPYLASFAVRVFHGDSPRVDALVLAPLAKKATVAALGMQPGIPPDGAALALPASIAVPPGRPRWAAILRNGSAGVGNPPQVLQPDQHGERAFELAVEVAAEPLQPVRSSASPNASAQMSGRFSSSVRRIGYQGRISPVLVVTGMT